MMTSCHRYVVHHGEFYIARNLACSHADDQAAARIWIVDLAMTKPLTLNARGSHWAVGHRAKATIKSAAYWRARQLGMPQLQHARIELRYVPHDNRKRDVDNLVATLKPAVDGLRAAGVLIDDDPTHAELVMPVIEHPRTDRRPMVYLVVTDLGAPS